jgi:hypothetical protein
MKNDQQENLKETQRSIHYTTQHTDARLFLERDAAFPPSSQKGSYQEINSIPDYTRPRIESNQTAEAANAFEYHC